MSDKAPVNPNDLPVNEEELLRRIDSLRHKMRRLYADHRGQLASGTSTAGSLTASSSELAGYVQRLLSRDHGRRLNIVGQGLTQEDPESWEVCEISWLYVPQEFFDRHPGTQEFWLALVRLLLSPTECRYEDVPPPTGVEPYPYSQEFAGPHYKAFLHDIRPGHGAGVAGYTDLRAFLEDLRMSARERFHVLRAAAKESVLLDIETPLPEPYDIAMHVQRYQERIARLLLDFDTCYLRFRLFGWMLEAHRDFGEIPTLEQFLSIRESHGDDSVGFQFQEYVLAVKAFVTSADELPATNAELYRLACERQDLRSEGDPANTVRKNLRRNFERIYRCPVPHDPQAWKDFFENPGRMS